MKSTNPKLPLRTAFFWIFISTILVSGSALTGLLYYRHIKKQHLLKPQYNIVAIVQTTPDKERLKTVYLAELLKLSVDHPTNLFRFNTKEAKKILLSTPLMTSAHVKKIMPGTIFVEYTLRKPVAYLVDYTNTVVDQEAVPFPFKPFFTPKKLPEIYLGMTEPLIWGKEIRDVKSKLALYLIELISQHCCSHGSTLVRVDVSNALADSYGQRQIVVIIEDRIEKKNEQGSVEVINIPQILRLSVDNYRQELANYIVLRPSLQKQTIGKANPIIIDLRISELGYIKGAF